MKNDTKVRGHFTVQHLDKNGKLKGEYDMPNGITTEGMNHMLETEFNGGTPITTWYTALIDNAGFSALASTDTAAQIGGSNGWSELTNYSEATRPEWTAGTAAARAITNAVTVDFSINATVSINGIFIVGANAKSATTSTLWSTASFASAVSAVSGDTLKITYTVSG
jgi:hypothetical protein